MKNKKNKDWLNLPSQCQYQSPPHTPTFLNTPSFNSNWQLHWLLLCPLSYPPPNFWHFYSKLQPHSPPCFQNYQPPYAFPRRIYSPLMADCCVIFDWGGDHPYTFDGTQTSGANFVIYSALWFWCMCTNGEAGRLAAWYWRGFLLYIIREAAATKAHTKPYTVDDPDARVG